MPIKNSSARPVESLVGDLASDSPAAREAAVARLTVLGPRAVERLLAVVQSASPAPIAQVMALRTLEAIGDARAFDAVLAAVDATTADVAQAAVSATRPFLLGPRGAAVVDRLTTVLFDTRRDASLRLTALQVLRDLKASTIAPLLEVLRDDPNEAVRAAVAASPATPRARATQAADEGLPENASDLAEALAAGGATLALPVLSRIIERVRERESSEPLPGRAAWTVVRGRAHVALANRGSRLGLYDLREAFERASVPLPVDFLAAMSAAGDASCLDSVAGAYARAEVAGPEYDWWRAHLADAFRAIVQREGITRRHAVVKKIEKRLGPLEALWAGRAGAAGEAGKARGAGPAGRAARAGGAGRAKR